MTEHKPHSAHVDYLAIKNALVILRDGSLTASMASNAPPALDALERLVEQFEVERVALRIACRDLQDWHADFRDNRAVDYEPPDDGDVEQLMADLRRKAVWSQEEIDADRAEARERAERFGWTGSNPASIPDAFRNDSGNGDPLRDALHLLADNAMESGAEIGELIEERRAQSPATCPSCGHDAHTPRYCVMHDCACGEPGDSPWRWTDAEGRKWKAVPDSDPARSPQPKRLRGRKVVDPASSRETSLVNGEERDHVG